MIISLYRIFSLETRWKHNCVKEIFYEQINSIISGDNLSTFASLCKRNNVLPHKTFLEHFLVCPVLDSSIIRIKITCNICKIKIFVQSAKLLFSSKPAASSEISKILLIVIPFTSFLLIYTLETPIF